jgi:hypothetical protein
MRGKQKSKTKEESYIKLKALFDSQLTKMLGRLQDHDAVDIIKLLQNDVLELKEVI